MLNEQRILCERKLATCDSSAAYIWTLNTILMSFLLLSMYLHIFHSNIFVIYTLAVVLWWITLTELRWVYKKTIYLTFNPSDLQFLTLFITGTILDQTKMNFNHTKRQIKNWTKISYWTIYSDKKFSIPYERYHVEIY